MLQAVNKDALIKYISSNEVVYQNIGELIEVSNDKEKNNRETLFGYFSRANREEVYTKQSRLVKEGWPELTDWSTDNDVLFLLDGVGVLVCIPKKEALANNLMEE